MILNEPRQSFATDFWQWAN